VAGRAATSNNLASNGTQRIVLKNVLLKEEQMLSRIAKNRTKVDSGELCKTADTALALRAVSFYFISRLIREDTWQTKG
jgi:hypothetical protein